MLLFGGSSVSEYVSSSASLYLSFSLAFNRTKQIYCLSDCVCVCHCFKALSHNDRNTMADRADSVHCLMATSRQQLFNRQTSTLWLSWSRGQQQREMEVQQWSAIEVVRISAFSSLCSSSRTPLARVWCRFVVPPPLLPDQQWLSLRKGTCLIEVWDAYLTSLFLLPSHQCFLPIVLFCQAAKCFAQQNAFWSLIFWALCALARLSSPPLICWPIFLTSH